LGHKIGHGFEKQALAMAWVLRDGASRLPMPFQNNKTIGLLWTLKQSVSWEGSVVWRQSPDCISWSWWLKFVSLWVAHAPHDKFGQIYSPEVVISPGSSKLGNRHSRAKKTTLPAGRLPRAKYPFPSAFFLLRVPWIEATLSHWVIRTDHHLLGRPQALNSTKMECSCLSLSHHLLLGEASSLLRSG
jgi:hypothetical protein